MPTLRGEIIRAGREQPTKTTGMRNFTPLSPPSCRECYHFAAGRCLFTRAIVAESFLCLRFTARQDPQPPTSEPIQVAPLTTPGPLPAVKLIEPSPELPTVAVEFSDPPDAVARLRRLHAVRSQQQQNER
jgi:hypothetical protein